MEIGLNIGCGGARFPDEPDLHWQNIDGDPKTKADIIMDCTKNKLPFDDNSVKKIVCIHMMEHMSYRLVPAVIKEWYRVLKPGGSLTIETPDFDKGCQDYLNGNEARLENLFGRQLYGPGDYHLYGWNHKRTKALLESIGFINVTELFDYSYHIDLEPCTKCIAYK
jgi:SAM-dependent methyltransferase